MLSRLWFLRLNHLIFAFEFNFLELTGLSFFSQINTNLLNEIESNEMT